MIKKFVKTLIALIVVYIRENSVSSDPSLKQRKTVHSILGEKRSSINIDKSTEAHSATLLHSFEIIFNGF